ncbi:MAG: methylated-DNA--[protein]-cysteine S-methyltransferase [Cohaesibacter sp.]|nr:methylated-DNA--[protein]-cysteine S-methyltransferase [Cohaesibacter sp.]
MSTSGPDSDTRIYYCHMESPLGPLLMGGEGGRLQFLHFPKSARRRQIQDHWLENTEPFKEAIAQLTAYFALELTQFDLSYHLEGTAFQISVWEQLAQIPYGELLSYGDIAKALGNEGASRAVGLANNANPLPIIIPCHRVIGSDGKLVGFGGGMETKIWLLEHEGIMPSSIKAPGQMAFSF